MWTKKYFFFKDPNQAFLFNKFRAVFCNWSTCWTATERGGKSIIRQLNKSIEHLQFPLISAPLENRLLLCKSFILDTCDGKILPNVLCGYMLVGSVLCSAALVIQTLQQLQNLPDLLRCKEPENGAESWRKDGPHWCGMKNHAWREKCQGPSDLSPYASAKHVS